MRKSHNCRYRRRAFVGLGKADRSLPVDDRAGRNGARDPGVPTNDCSLADDRRAAEDRCVGVDDDIVFDRRVSLLPSPDRPIAAERGFRPERDPLIDLDVVPDAAGFADNDSGPVIDEESLADHRAGVDVDTRMRVGSLGHDPGDDRNLLLVEVVSDAVGGDRLDAGVAQDDLVERGRSGVAVVGGLDILEEDVANVGHRFHQVDQRRPCALVAVPAVAVDIAVLERSLEVAQQLEADMPQGVVDEEADLLALDLLRAVDARKEDRQKPVENLIDFDTAG